VMLRAMQEWETHQRQAPRDEAPAPAPDASDLPTDGPVR
jgi:hypothetical protein